MTVKKLLNNAKIKIYFQLLIWFINGHSMRIKWGGGKLSSSMIFGFYGRYVGIDGTENSVSAFISVIIGSILIWSVSTYLWVFYTFRSQILPSYRERVSGFYSPT